MRFAYVFSLWRNLLRRSPSFLSSKNLKDIGNYVRTDLLYLSVSVLQISEEPQLCIPTSCSSAMSPFSACNVLPHILVFFMNQKWAVITVILQFSTTYVTSSGFTNEGAADEWTWQILSLLEKTLK